MVDASPQSQSPTFEDAEYVGRFAPSPSGALHFGSLVAAVGSYLQAQSAKGIWRVRIEDIDEPRSIRGAAEQIIRTLDEFGFEWDGPIEYQSQRLEFYAAALSRLHSLHQTYSCSCSRAQFAANDETRYPGTCRDGVQRPSEPLAVRFVVAPGVVDFTDVLQGYCSQDVAAVSGDFVIKRRDGYFAYHLAVVVDDADQSITEVVRGCDLLDVTPRHVLLQRALGFPTPRYCHLPLALDAAGRKLSKSAQSLAVDSANAAEVLWQALTFLRQRPPDSLRAGSSSEVWEWARSHWNLEPLRRLKSDRAPAP